MSDEEFYRFEIILYKNKKGFQMRFPIPFPSSLKLPTSVTGSEGYPTAAWGLSFDEHPSKITILTDDYQGATPKVKKTKNYWSISGWFCSKDEALGDCPILKRGERSSCIFIDDDDFGDGPVYINSQWIEKRADKCEFLMRERVTGGLKWSFKNRSSASKGDVRRTKYAVLIYGEMLFESEDKEEATKTYNLYIERYGDNLRFIQFEDIQSSKPKVNE